MKMNDKGLALLKEFEGCKLEAYLDLGGVLTIGYGHTKDVKLGDKITQEQADELLKQDLFHFETGTSMLVKILLTGNQFSALVCFAYNVGLANFEASTLLRCVNAKMFDEAAEQFLRWNKVHGAPISGLSRRRAAESDLFMTS